MCFPYQTNTAKTSNYNASNALWIVSLIDKVTASNHSSSNACVAALSVIGSPFTRFICTSSLHPTSTTHSRGYPSLRSNRTISFVRISIEFYAQSLQLPLPVVAALQLRSSPFPRTLPSFACNKNSLSPRLRTADTASATTRDPRFCAYLRGRFRGREQLHGAEGGDGRKRHICLARIFVSRSFC